MANMKINMMEIADEFNVQLRVKRYKEFKVRLWIALKLIKFACWICRFNLKVEEDINANTK